MADSRDRQHRAHVGGTIAGVAAGTASAPFGAAKLRDSFRESYPIKFRRGLAHVEHVARREGMSQQQTSRVLRVASHGKPGFVPLVAATTAASLAGGARRYERHLQHKEAMGKSAFGVEHSGTVEKGDKGKTAGLAAGAAAGGMVAGSRGYIAAHDRRFYHHIRAARVALYEGNRTTDFDRGLRHIGAAYGHLRPTIVGHRPTAAGVTTAVAASGAVLASRRRVAKSAFGVEHPLEKMDRRRAVEVGSGGGAVLAGRSAVRSRRAGRGHLVRAGDLERDSNASFAASRQQGDVVAQRLARHVGSGPGSLPRTGGNLANTGRQHLRQQAHLQAGLTSRDASRAAAGAGAKALRRSKGRLVLAAGLAGTAAVASTSRKRY